MTVLIVELSTENKGTGVAARRVDCAHGVGKAALRNLNYLISAIRPIRAICFNTFHQSAVNYSSGIDRVKLKQKLPSAALELSK